MMDTKKIGMAALAMLAVTGFALSGCGNESAETVQAEKSSDPNVQANVANADPSHGGWWCVEHGVPEEVCTRCSTHLAADFQKKGDWCKQHNRPESQCFICHPELEAKFAAQYEAKTGHKPPQPTE